VSAPVAAARLRWGWIAAFVVVSVLSFPHPVAGRVLDLGWLVAWLGPACLVAGLRDLSPWRALRHTFVAVWLTHSLILHWFYVVTVTYGHAPAAVGVIAPIGAALYPALITCWFGLGWAWLRERGSASPFVAACLWVALEHLRGFLFTGFPWASLGYSQHENSALLGIASLAGVYGLSIAVFLVGASLALLIEALRAGRGVPGQLWVAFAVALALHGLGPLVRPVDPPGGETIRVAVLQGNIDQGIKWSRDWYERTIRIYEDLSREAAGEGARLIVWPESAVPGAVELDEQLTYRLSRLARETEAVFVIGSVGVDFGDGSDAPSRRFFDSAFLIQPDGHWDARYDKSHLVPFGEYVPFRAVLGEFIEGVATGVASSDVSPGEGPRAISASLRTGTGRGAVPLGARTLKLGTPVCYELLFPDLVRRFVADGAQLLLGITNDAWYGRTGAPYQFLAMTAMRSAETGTWTARAANTGVSAIIDSTGRVRDALGIFERGKVVATVPLRDLQKRPTLYVRIGDAFAHGCWGVALLAFVYTGFRARKGSRGNEKE
jgi:apolipoprotein N-acyltransferase